MLEHHDSLVIRQIWRMTIADPKFRIILPEVTMRLTIYATGFLTLLLLVACGDDSNSEPCTVVDNDNGTATISCPDGTSVTVRGGTDGTHGSDGTDGTNGEGGNGSPGSCTVVDNHNGTTTITCPDGSTATIQDGMDGGNIAGVIEGSFTIRNSRDVVALQNVSEITGALTIDAPGLLHVELPKLESIGHNLRIASNPTLETLDAPLLERIDGRLDVDSNKAFTSLQGIENVTFIGDGLSIRSNDVLTSLQGLESLSTIEGELTIRGNSALTSLQGLEGLTTIGGALAIGDPLSSGGNAVLASLQGLENLTAIEGGLTIMFNPALSSLKGLEALTSIGESVWFFNNDCLPESTITDFIDNPNLTISGDVYASGSSLENCNHP